MIMNFETYNEEVNVPVKVGDTILRGRFKNVKVKVKKIGKDQKGQPTINGQKMLTFRMLSKAEKEKEKKLEESKHYDNESDLEDLISEYEKEYPVNLDVDIEDDVISLNWIRFKTKHQGQGYGQEFMDRLLTFADDRGLIIILTPWNWERRTQKRLVRWYKSMGFKFEKGYKRDMVRLPE
jgi:GNAT superfamily N-acetyltransferase